MGLFDRLRSSSCSAHHWGDWNQTDLITIEPVGSLKVRIQRLDKRWCQHDSCHAADERQVELALIPFDNFSRLMETYSEHTDEVDGLLDAMAEGNCARAERCFERIWAEQEETNRGHAFCRFLPDADMYDGLDDLYRELMDLAIDFEEPEEDDNDE